MKPSLLPMDTGPSAVLEKRLLESRNNNKYFITYVLRIPFTYRSISIPVPKILNLNDDDSNVNGGPQHLSTRGRRSDKSFKSKFKVLFVLVVVAFTATFIFISCLRKVAQHHQIEIQLPFQESSTLQFSSDELRQIWMDEIRAGHYPSSRKLPESLHFNELIENPTLPPFQYLAPIVQSHIVSPPDPFASPYPLNDTVIPLGPDRHYFHRQLSSDPYPPRPVPYSAIDLDVVMEHCDFSTNQYVRDCLEILSFGSGLDVRNRVRRSKLSDWKHLYTSPSSPEQNIALSPKFTSNDEACDSDNPRIFHMFWAGPFTDKPYLALTSFLYTQNLGLHLRQDSNQTQTETCRPQFWVWINPGPAASIPNKHAVKKMFDSLAANPWSAPFLHERFRDSIKFKMWNTTEQLDGVPELAPFWRDHELFNSGGVKFHSPKKNEKSRQNQKFGQAEAEAEDQRKNREAEESEAAQAAAEKIESNSKLVSDENIEEEEEEDNDSDDPMLNRVGSSSDADYDRLSVVLSDMARFIVTHRFGGVYLDADTIFLRDWEELWGWNGAFAYRWSRLEKYNTAVLKMHKNSALGSFLFKTALANGLDFHPMTVSKYTKDAQLDGLLLRLPDALFDSAWLTTEDFQMDRPPFPFFKELVFIYVDILCLVNVQIT